MATATWTSLCVSTPTMTSCAKLLVVIRSLQERWLWHRWNGRTRLSWALWSGSYKVTFVLPVRSAPEKADRSPKRHQWPAGDWVRPSPVHSVCRRPQGDSGRRGSNPRLQPWEGCPANPNTAGGEMGPGGTTLGQFPIRSLRIPERSHEDPKGSKAVQFAQGGQGR